MSQKLTEKNKLLLQKQKDRYDNWVKEAPLCKCGCGKKVGVTKKVLSYCIASYKYASFIGGHNTSTCDRGIKIKKEAQQILIGGMFGDSYIGYGNKHSTYPRLSFTHSIKQREYVEWKVSKLFPMLFSYDKVYKTSFGGSVFKTVSRSYPFLSIYHSLFYRGKKIITKDVCDLLTPLSLAVWFMDDGSNDNRVGEYCYLWTCSYTIEEQQIIKKMFAEKFNIETIIKTNIKKQFFIYIVDSKRFLFLIRKYIPECMRYKIENTKN